MEKLNCFVCKKEMYWEKMSKGQKDSLRRSGRIYCSRECSKEYCRVISSKTMAKTNRKYASERMKNNNPMKNKISREKMSATLKAIGHKPIIRGGNGYGPTVPQKLLANILKWDMELSIITNQKRGSGYPSCYKIDIADEILKIGIEVDGRSHGLLKKQAEDKKKTLFLNGLGWTILRFKNEEILKDLDSCVKKVLSIIS